MRPWLLLMGLLTGTAALACPDCPTAQAVRASALSEGFWNHLVMAAVPFLLIGALSALVYRIGLSPRERPRLAARRALALGSDEAKEELR